MHTFINHLGVSFLNIFIPYALYSQLSLNYPNDTGIEADPDVLFVEKFDEDISTILTGYSTVVNSQGMSTDHDIPPGSKTGSSLRISSKQGENTGGYLYRNFPDGFEGDEIYLRYYVKYPEISKKYFHHEGVWIGGYYPPLEWPHPRAGICGLGDSRIAVAYEMMDSSWLHPYTHIAPYIYWGDMRSFPGGVCWGNFMQCGDHNPPPVANTDEWICVEIMVGLNDPVTDFNGELRTWINGIETGHWGKGFPEGNWVWGNFFIEPGGEAFEGFRWRTIPELVLNHIWIQFYHSSPDAPSSYMLYDNLVIATKYIGPIYDPPSSGNNNSLNPVSIRPNPGSQFIIINGLEQNSRLFIHDINGNKVLETRSHKEELLIDTSRLKPGIYILSTTINGVWIREKLIIR